MRLHPLDVICAAEYVIFPACDDVHWTLCVLAHPAQLLARVESETSSHGVLSSLVCGSQAVLAVFDSVASRKGKPVKSIFLEYLVRLLAQKLHQTVAAMSLTVTSHISVRTPGVPEQVGNHDCALHVLGNLRSFMHACDNSRDSFVWRGIAGQIGVGTVEGARPTRMDIMDKVFVLGGRIKTSNSLLSETTAAVSAVAATSSPPRTSTSEPAACIVLTAKERGATILPSKSAARPPTSAAESYFHRSAPRTAASTVAASSENMASVWYARRASPIHSAKKKYAPAWPALDDAPAPTTSLEATAEQLLVVAPEKAGSMNDEKVSVVAAEMEELATDATSGQASFLHEGAHAKLFQDHDTASADVKLFSSITRGDIGACCELLCDGVPPTVEADGVSALLHAIQIDQVVIATLLIDAGADVNAVGGSRSSSPLQAAVFSNRLCLASKLVNAGALVNLATGSGLTSLRLACAMRSSAAVSLLLCKGADVNQRGLLGWTPLLEAAFNNNPDCVTELLNAGADKMMADERGWTPLLVCAAHDHAGLLVFLLWHIPRYLPGQLKDAVILAARRSMRLACATLWHRTPHEERQEVFRLFDGQQEGGFLSSLMGGAV